MFCCRSTTAAARRLGRRTAKTFKLNCNKLQNTLLISLHVTYDDSIGSNNKGYKMTKISDSGMRPDPGGFAWWNSITTTERSFWLRRAGSAVPADAYTARLLSAEGWNTEFTVELMQAIEANK